MKIDSDRGKEAQGPQDKCTGESRRVSFENAGVLQEVLGVMKGPASKVAVINTAPAQPEQMGEMYLKAFGQLGRNQVCTLNLNGRNVQGKKRWTYSLRCTGFFHRR